MIGLTLHLRLGQVGDVRGLADSRVGVRAVRRKQNNQFLLALIEEEEEGLPELRC